MEHTLVIGGGAAGMAAAVCAARRGERVVLLERMDRVGRKLLATGNGRCNLMNTGPLRYPGGAGFAAQVLARCGVREQTAFWEELGLRLREEEGGRVYPASGQAATVLDTLRFALEALGVDIRTDCPVSGLRRQGGQWAALCPGGPVRAGRVIVTAGGQAQPKLGSDGSGYQLLTAQGHRLRTPTPALVQLETERRPIQGLGGIRVRCAVSVLSGGRRVHTEHGELLFADYGVSGVCVMQCARYAAPGDRLLVDLRPALGLRPGEDAAGLLRARRADWPAWPMERLLTGLCVPRLGLALLTAAGIQARGRTVASLTDAECARLAAAIAAFPLAVTGRKGFDSAQVTAGGIDPADFDPATMASALAPGLHAAGEVLDVDGDCGGFNLMFAVGSGILAGRNCPD